MSQPPSTCWTETRAAAAGSPGHRDGLARRYLPVVRAYLAARWRGSVLVRELEDAVQDVFAECFRPSGPLEAAAAGRVPSFRAYLHGVARNVARRFEARPRREAVALPDLPEDEHGLSRVFDRAWARALMAEAAARQRERAAQAGAAALRRIELLRLRFEEGRPIRDIARLWGEDAGRLHREYATARQEFRAALLEVVAFHHPGTPDEVEQEAADLLRVLS
jgi:RNA polymerase sigma-70 factor (ECF subfamily)